LIGEQGTSVLVIIAAPLEFLAGFSFSIILISAILFHENYFQAG